MFNLLVNIFSVGSGKTVITLVPGCYLFELKTVTNFVLVHARLVIYLPNLAMTIKLFVFSANLTTLNH